MRNTVDLSLDDRILCAGTEANKDGDAFIIFWYGHVLLLSLFRILNKYCKGMHMLKIF